MSETTPTFKTLSLKQSLSKMINTSRWDISLEAAQLLSLVELKSVDEQGYLLALLQVYLSLQVGKEGFRSHSSAFVYLLSQHP